MASQNKRLLLLVLIVTLSSAQLFYDGLFKNLKNNDLNAKVSDALPITTSCNQNAMYSDYTPPADFIMMTGYLSVNITNSNSALAFTFVGALAAQKDFSKLSSYPLMIWMNGGPGSSSQLGNLLEMGPIMLDQNTAKLYWNNNTWAREINILYLDQPIGTGFSYIQDDQDLPTNMNGVAAHVWTALQNLYLNPNGCLYGLNMTGVPLFIAGESYAGKYAPAITEFIHKQQKAPVSPLKLNLKGMMIVDGFTDPYSTLAQMGMYAFQLGLIDYQERMRVEGYILQGLYLIDSNQMTEAKYMFNDALEHIMSYAGDVNAYNIRLFNVTVQFPMENFLNSQRSFLGFNTNKQYLQSNSSIYEAFSSDFMARDCVKKVEYLLSENVPVLVCSGQLDLIVDTPGTMMWVDNLNFPQSEEFRASDFTLWKVNGAMAGYTQSAGSLTYFNVNQAGHMVPGDQPVNSYDMMWNWVQNNRN